MSDIAPMIYTSKGNLPLDTLRREVKWNFSMSEISLVEEYFLGDEVVKRGVDIYKLPEGTVFNLKQGAING